MARRILPNLNSVNRAVQRNALKAAINKSLNAYMTSQTNANLRAVNNATRALIKTYIEEQQAPANVPTGNGGNKPPGNGNGGNQSRAIVPVGNVTPVGPNMKAPLANRGANENPRQPTAVNLNRLRGIAKNGGSNNNTILKNQTNFVNALMRNFQNHPNVKAAKNVLNARRAAKNITAGAIASAKNKAAANAEQRAREAAIKAAQNAAEANKAAKNIAANEAASAAEKQAAANAKAAANKAAAAAANAAKKAAEIKSKWKRAGQGVVKAVQAGNAFSAAGANSRRQKLLNEAKRNEAINAAHANLMSRINTATTNGQLNAVISNIERNGKNFNAQKKMTLQSKVKDKRRQIVQSLTTNYNEFLKEIRNAHSPAMITQLKQRLARNERKTVGKKFTLEQRANLSSRVNNKERSLKGPGPSSNAPKNGGPNNNMSKLSLSQLNSIIRLTKARLNKGQGANGNKNRLARATKLANALRPKKKGLFGHIGGAIGAVGGAAVGGVKAAGGAAKYVAAGTVHHASKGAKFGLGVVASGVGRMGQSHTFNVTVGRKKIPNTKIGNNNGNKKPGKLARAVQKNENIAAARKAYQQSVGGNASENSVSAAGALGALAVAGGVKAAAGVKRAVNIGRAVKTGTFTAKTLRYPVKLR